MRKKVYCLVMAVFFVVFTACGDKAESGAALSAQSAGKADASAQEAENVAEGAESIDVDLTQLSSTMVYSEVYNMMVTPEDYIGKMVKMKGQFSVYEDQETGGCYYTVLIADATACCSQGLEFVLAEAKSYPEDYPQQGEEITVTGEFQTYQEGEYSYCHLVNARFS